jgi:hypothetical protein
MLRLDHVPVGMRALPRLCMNVCPGVCLTTEEKVRKNFRQGVPKVPCLTMPTTILFTDLSIIKQSPRLTTWPPLPLAYACGRGANPHSGKYLPNCRNSGFPSHLNLSRSLQSRLVYRRRIVEHPDSRDYACY